MFIYFYLDKDIATTGRNLISNPKRASLVRKPRYGVVKNCSEMIISEICIRLKPSDFQSLHHMKRTTNGVAPRLANEAIKFDSNLEWINCVILYWLSNIVNRDFVLK